MKMQTQIRNDIENLVSLLKNKDDKVRTQARKSLVEIGKPAVFSLCEVLETSHVFYARWCAAKALGEIDDVKSIPSLVKALEDDEPDVVWLAAEALGKFKQAAWSELLRALIKNGSKSILFRKAAHHVLRYQNEEGFEDLLKILRKSLESETIAENTSVAAANLLNRMNSVKPMIR